MLAFMLCLGIFISGCHTASKNNNEVSSATAANTENATVISILSKSYHSLALPFKDTCFDTIAVQRHRLPDSLSKFKTYGQIVGKISETKNYIAILYSIPADVQLPVLHTFNANGGKISSLKLFIGNCCGENEDCSGLSTVQITKDLHIILKDSMQTFERSKRKYDKKKNIRVIKKYEEYKIDSIGKIIKISPGV